ncbi:hypothetical protein DICVIV_03226 [Dictyocaulus viviparus]|uniref:Nucleotide-diphospho-sugar transferase domain-containing protein n=1 Tax=Dictyocaulus viviparus TaxID=29172 RepID=A0A0D8Y3N1_DICVI|nr:hypothetical protein DICVIV_03226 [Dictyocaulus viviparus]
MGPCPPLYGNVTVFVAYAKSSMKTLVSCNVFLNSEYIDSCEAYVLHYQVAQQSLQCYLKGVNYTLLMVELGGDARVQEKCSRNNQKHCAAAAYLPDTDWMLVLDADTGVVNPNHCIEEWIDDRVDIIFYERFFNWEIASGNYLVKNTEFAVRFLKSWGDYEFTLPSNWNGLDNGVIQILILKSVIPHALQETKNCDILWHNATDYNTYMAYVSCVKQMLGATRLWPGKVRIYRRAHGWVRDGFITADKWSDTDFMLHGWKHQKVGFDGWESPFKKNLDPSKCGVGFEGWDWIPEKHVNTSDIRRQLADFEKHAGMTYPIEARSLIYISLPDVGECYPNCDDET